MAEPINILSVQDMLAAGRKADARHNNGFVTKPSALAASSMQSSSDFGVSSYLGAIKGTQDFVWEIDKWGDTQYKVTD